MRYRVLAIAAAAALSATAAFAHISVSPRQATTGAEQKYVVRAPNERDTATVVVTGEFPPEVVVSAVEPVAGWKVETKRNETGRIVGATWTGSIAPRAVAEFGLIAKNPASPTTLSWKFVQRYADGVTMEWTGPAGSRTPAAVVQVTAAAAESGHADHH